MSSLRMDLRPAFVLYLAAEDDGADQLFETARGRRRGAAAVSGGAWRILEDRAGGGRIDRCVFKRLRTHPRSCGWIRLNARMSY